MEQTNSLPAAPSRLLSFFCLLAMISSGLLAIIGLSGIFATSKIADMYYTNMKNSAIQVNQLDILEEYMGMLTGFFITVSAILFLLNVLKLLGVVQMWKGKKKGFLLYVIPAVMMVFIYFFLGYAAPELGGILLLAGIDEGVMIYSIGQEVGISIGILALIFITIFALKRQEMN